MRIDIGHPRRRFRLPGTTLLRSGIAAAVLLAACGNSPVVEPAQVRCGVAMTLTAGARQMFTCAVGEGSHTVELRFQHPPGDYDELTKVIGYRSDAQSIDVEKLDVACDVVYGNGQSLVGGTRYLSGVVSTGNSTGLLIFRGPGSVGESRFTVTVRSLDPRLSGRSVQLILDRRTK